MLLRTTLAARVPVCAMKLEGNLNRFKLRNAVNDNIGLEPVAS
jgi:hypothetical protein